MSYEASWRAALRPWWHAVARGIDVAAGSVLGVELLGERFVLWRAPTGELSMTDDRCPHRSVALSAGSVDGEGCLRCAYHGWRFDRGGNCVEIPQLQGRRLPGAEVRIYRVVERYGYVWACLVDETQERGGVPEFDELDAGTHWYWMGWNHDWSAQCFRQMENFCDVAHFAVLHDDTFGHRSGVPVEPERVTVDGRRLRFDFHTPVCDPTLPPTPDRPILPGFFGYQVTLPCTIHLRGASGPGSVMFVHACPLDVDRTRVFWGSTFPHGVAFDDEEYSRVEEAIWAPDRRLVATQPTYLPLDPRAELHLPHDRFALAFRRALAELGVPDPSHAAGC